ncbi:ABC transporter permease [Pseudomonas chengduensis]|nr:ABC transporter permease [Pseudomonas chengduensis]MDH1866523.1 ABC transporter permease [Pseudomonas chengduensis]
MPLHLPCTQVITAFLSAFTTIQRLRLLPLLRYAVRQLLIVLAVAILVFCILRLLPVDPSDMLLPPNGTEAERLAVRAALGLDQSLFTQFGVWLQQLLHGDLGVSIQSGEAVHQLLWHALPVTLQLVCFALFLGIVLGGGSGLLAFRYRHTPLRNTLEISNALALSVPEFLWGILLMLLFGIGLRWLPFFGQIAPLLSVPDVTGFLFIDTLLAGDLTAWLSVLGHYCLPALALALAIAPMLMRILYSSLNQIYLSDYVRSARLRGLSENRLLLRHALRNAILPALNLLGVQTGTLIGGTLLIENLYGLQGIGYLMLQAIRHQDLPVIQGIALVYAVAVLLINQLTDWLQYRLDPRGRAA